MAVDFLKWLEAYRHREKEDQLTNSSMSLKLIIYWINSIITSPGLWIYRFICILSPSTRIKIKVLKSQFISQSVGHFHLSRQQIAQICIKVIIIRIQSPIGGSRHLMQVKMQVCNWLCNVCAKGQSPHQRRRRDAATFFNPITVHSSTSNSPETLNYSSLIPWELVVQMNFLQRRNSKGKWRSRTDLYRGNKNSSESLRFSLKGEIKRLTILKQNLCCLSIITRNNDDQKDISCRLFGQKETRQASIEL